MSEDKEVKPVHGMFAVPAPPAFDFDRTSEWPSWIQLFDDYRFVSGLTCSQRLSSDIAIAKEEGSGLVVADVISCLLHQLVESSALILGMSS
ncbi:hypothetical protein MRX96_010891 [Rhipicephalus microplus]